MDIMRVTSCYVRDTHCSRQLNFAIFFGIAKFAKLTCREMSCNKVSVQTRHFGSDKDSRCEMSHLLADRCSRHIQSV